MSNCTPSVTLFLVERAAKAAPISQQSSGSFSANHPSARCLPDRAHINELLEVELELLVCGLNEARMQNWNKSNLRDRLNSPIALGTSVVAGAAATYGAGRVLGFLPGWFGPESDTWNIAVWTDEAERIINQLEADPSYLCTARTDIGKASRRVRLARYFSFENKAVRGVVKFGSDLEGPPRHVHGGCTAATMNEIASDLASNLVRFPVAHSSSLNVDYFLKIPLGSQLGFDCILSDDEDSLAQRISTRVRFFSLKNPSVVYAEGRVIFENIRQKSRI